MEFPLCQWDLVPGQRLMWPGTPLAEEIMVNLANDLSTKGDYNVKKFPGLADLIK